MTLITGAVTLPTGEVRLITHSYMCKNGREVLTERAGNKVVEMYGPLAFISRLPYLIRGGEAPGQGTVIAR